MPNFPVHNFGMDKMLEGVQGGLKSYVAGETAAFKKREEVQEKLDLQKEKEKEKYRDKVTDYFIKKYDSMSPVTRKSLRTTLTPMFEVPGFDNLFNVVDEYATGNDNKMAMAESIVRSMDEAVGIIVDPNTPPEKRKETEASYLKLFENYKVFNDGKSHPEHSAILGNMTKMKMEALSKQQPLGEQEKINLKTKADIGKSARDRAFERLSPEEQKQTVMRPDVVLKPEKVSGTLTEGSVKKSIDELSSFDVKVSAKLYGDYLKYRKAFEKTMPIDNAREQALSRVQQESQGIKPATGKSYDYLWK